MQKGIRINEGQLLHLATKARRENTKCGYLFKKSADTGKWQLRWFICYQNLLFYYENDTTPRPSGVALLEGCYCERILTTCKPGKDTDKQFCFAIYYRKEGQRQYDLRTETEAECAAWIEAICMASFSKVLEQKEQLEQKHLHLLQILDSERQAKWHYVQQTDELAAEVKKLKNELREFKKERRISNDKLEEESEEIHKIKKVQSFFRGWLCRRRWKQIVDEYIRSDHAESMRKRNSIVFGMVECEEEYVKQLSTLVTVFLRPFRMAASSKKPPITHEDVNSIFLNSETLLFLHQIFLKGLMARMENWPTLVLGDLFDMLLPMLGIYQEYVRNHHYSLQVLAECKQKPEYNQLLHRYEEKSQCEGRTLEAFLTYPMHQIPRYIITIHEMLAHTPHDHVERKSLEFAQSQLEELSKIMHDEVSETENIRKNLAIERMIVEGCDILLDVTQTFVRQGSLVQTVCDKHKGGLGRFTKETKKEVVRQVFLFTNHILFTTRTSNGRLHLAKNYGKVSLIECRLEEDPSADTDDDASSYDSNLSLASQNSVLLGSTGGDHEGLEFRLILDGKSTSPIVVHLLASTVQEKAAWCSDISQCIENLHYSDLLNSSSMSDTSSVTMPQSVRSDPKLFQDSDDIKFSRTLNSCKVPQIRHASVDRLLDRLTDLRFLSIDFLNTFLLTYRVFSTSQIVIDALRRVYRNPEFGNLDPAVVTGERQPEVASHRHSFDTEVLTRSSPPVKQVQFSGAPPAHNKLLIKPQADKVRRISTGSMKIEVTSEKSPINVSGTKGGFQKYERDSCDNKPLTDVLPMCTEEQPPILLIPPRPKLAPIASCETLSEGCGTNGDEGVESSAESDDSPDDHSFTAAITITTSTATLASRNSHDCLAFAFHPGESSTDVLDSLTEQMLDIPKVLSSRASSDTLASSLCGSGGFASSSDTLVASSSARSSPLISPLFGSPKRSPVNFRLGFRSKKPNNPSVKIPTSSQLDALALSPATSPKFRKPPIFVRRATSTSCKVVEPIQVTCQEILSPSQSPVSSPKLKRAPSPLNYSHSSPNIISSLAKSRQGKRDSAQSDISVGSSCSSAYSPRSSFATTVEGSPPSAKAGTVVTSSRASTRRSSSTAATAAFAKAISGSAIPKDTKRFHVLGPADQLKPAAYNLNRKRESAAVIGTRAATMRVLNVLRHWVSKHSQDFEYDLQLKAGVKDMLEEMACNMLLLPPEHKAAANILCMLNKDDESSRNRETLEHLLISTSEPSKDNFETLSALDIAEQLTFLDHKIFMAIRSEELLNQGWMKPDKNRKSPNVLLVSKRFNEVSRLVVSEIIRRQNSADRVFCIEKWAAIADICRCLHNFNGVLQICAAFVNSSVYRLKKTWEKVSKQTKIIIEKLQTLVSSDGRFKNMRDALHRCDPPCIPYVGMYLTDLSFIEEGTPNVTEQDLVNFSKMRMVAHVIREIQVYQQNPYKIEHNAKVTAYVLDPSRLLGEEETYKASLLIEPRLSRVSMTATTINVRN